MRINIYIHICSTCNIDQGINRQGTGKKWQFAQNIVGTFLVLIRCLSAWEEFFRVNPPLYYVNRHKSILCHQLNAGYISLFRPVQSKMLFYKQCALKYKNSNLNYSYHANFWRVFWLLTGCYNFFDFAFISHFYHIPYTYDSYYESHSVWVLVTRI